MPDDREFPPDHSDPLDELLLRAHWPGPTPQQLSRLELIWDRARPKIRRASIWTAVASTAAVVMISFVVWKLLPTGPKPVDDTPVVIDDGKQSPAPSVEQPPAKTDGVISRRPTPLELALFQAAESTARQNRRFCETDPLEQAVVGLMKDPDAAVSGLIAKFDDTETAARRTIEELPQARGRRRAALARLLVGIEPPDALPVLLMLWFDATTRDIVEPTVVRLADVPTLATLIEAPQSFDARVRLLTEIGLRPEKEAQGLLIEAAIVPDTLPAALAAARRAAPPAELLFSALAHPRADVRVAAALLLGEDADPEITVKLVALARECPNRSEPWIALLPRTDAESRMIVEEARQDPQIMASVTLAEATRQLILHPVQVGVRL